jgi:hypothetical protein
MHDIEPAANTREGVHQNSAHAIILPDLPVTSNGSAQLGLGASDAGPGLSAFVPGAINGIARAGRPYL